MLRSLPRALAARYAPSVLKRVARGGGFGAPPRRGTCLYLGGVPGTGRAPGVPFLLASRPCPNTARVRCFGRMLTST